ncbi:MAG: lamin tail domain-containing protein, partial [Anaerolineae bacterium]
VAVNITNVLGYGQLEQEMVVIFNRGPGVNLSGWTLTGSSLNEYPFPNLFLWNGGSVRIHTTGGANTPTDLYWNRQEPHWFSGDTAILKNAAGEVMSSYTIP